MSQPENNVQIGEGCIDETTTVKYAIKWLYFRHRKRCSNECEALKWLHGSNTLDVISEVSRESRFTMIYRIPVEQPEIRSC